MKDLEDILLDSSSDDEDGEDDDDDYEYAVIDNEDDVPFSNTRKNYRRRNYFLGHMARMNFRRDRGTHGVGNDNLYSKYRGDIRPGR